MPIISVIVPVYNTEKRLEYCLNSLVNQTILKKDPNSLEIVIVNDASVDNSGAIIEYYRRLYPNIITVINKSQNEGVSVARNIGIKCSKGRYIVFVDSDDYVALNMYEDFVDTMLKYDVNMISGGFYRPTKHKYLFTTPELNQTEIITYESLKDKYLNLGKPSQSIWNRIYKRETLEKHLFLPGCADEDAGVFYPLITEYGKTILLPHKYYAYWNREDDSISSMLNNKVTDHILDVFDVTMDAFNYCRENNYDEEQTFLLTSLFGKVALYNISRMRNWEVSVSDENLMCKIYEETFKIFANLYNLYNLDYLDRDLIPGVINLAPNWFPMEFIKEDDIPPEIRIN